MDQKLAVSYEVVFGLAFDIEKTERRLSGFKPAMTDLGSGKAMFALARLEGFAALLRTRFAKRLIIVGGDEGRYRGETPTINRASAIRQMLVADLGVDSERVLSVPSNSNTGGNIAAIKGLMGAEKLAFNQVAVVTSHYHAPRAALMMAKDGLALPVYPAEAFPLLEGMITKDELVHGYLFGGVLAERLGEEIQGIADLIRGTYVPRTDTPASVA